ncbi:MAG TPA: TRAP transporter large permease subunit, partial [Candidatus Polarisedimenticolia bacterium]|nr:TRAP transporter large permease subunit [Candidatus Polarisedimenticolia bacterium]
MSVLPAVPLFTLSGYLLAAGGASERLVKVFDAVVGWLPGGAAIVTTLVFAFFTSFTGASGVTILTLGGLLLPVLIRSGYPESFAVGLITVSGSIGLLFPPSLPVILYGVNSMQPIDTLFLAGLVPGTLLVLLVSALGVRQGMAAGAARKPFSARSAYHAVREAGWELLLPVVVLVGIFGGFATLVEAAALTVLYAFFVECFVYKDLSIRRDLAGVVVDAAALIGGFLIILGVALGLTNYLIDAEVPTRLLDWMQQHIESRAMFLLMLNVFLIGVGAIMDIYSALFVVVPLIIPLGEAYGIHPVHLGIIFLANLELGYLTPPMGENLFLSSYRFGHPVLRVFRFTLPFYAVVAAGVLLITYLPFMTLGLIDP